MDTVEIKHQSLLNPRLPSKAGMKWEWSSLVGSSSSLAIASTAKQYPSLLFVVAPDPLTAKQIENELRFFLKNSEVPVLYFPDYETLPYDCFSPHPDILSQRLTVLNRLSTLHRGILITSVNTAMHQLPETSYVTANSFVLKVNDKIDLTDFKNNLISKGYRMVVQVMEHGEISIKGSLLDVFPMGATHPLRVDFLDDVVDSIRYFHPETQRSLHAIPEIILLPAHEIPLNDKVISEFRNRWAATFDVAIAHCPIYQDIITGHHAAGIEYYLPLFFDAPASLFDYLPDDSLIIRMGEAYEMSQNFWREIQRRYDQLGHDVTRPILEPHRVFFPPDDLWAKTKNYAQVQIHSQKATDQSSFDIESLPSLMIQPSSRDAWQPLKQWIENQSSPILFSVETLGRKETLQISLKSQGIVPESLSSWDEFLQKKPLCGIMISPLADGFQCHSPEFTIITETQLFGKRVIHRQKTSAKTSHLIESVIQNLTELHPGDPVVHLQHGIGRFLGLQTITIDQQTDEYLALEYAENAKLFVPVSALHLISRYSGTDKEHVALNKLGHSQWEKAKEKAFQYIYDVATELLEIHAKRFLKTRAPYQMNQEAYSQLIASFPFEETPDQKKAIEQVLHDFTLTKPMDRLVCGDVGFGKTEVAIRACFIAAQNKRQVAVLVPTTLLAQQHYETFKDRLAGWNIQVEMISRFRTSAEQQKILANLKEGKIDIIIGTHKLLQGKTLFKNLGLVIVDEEQRFGVRQKEQLKALRQEIDILTLTATPIPRTLHMAIAGIRDLSIISTPPARRLTIKTFIQEYQSPIIREAILREISRGGQVYYLHNQVESIQQEAKKISDIVPEAKVIVAHGQLKERELEKTMIDFYHRRFNVLVCSTIIESGLDIPSANTLIVNRADKFGLAQLHQLRGRVGRSHQQAYAYFLTPPPKTISKDAQLRLEAIAKTGDLGAGFIIASHDMEIRGAGELLGEEQSGNMEAIGYNLYLETLEKAVKSIKAGKIPTLKESMEEPMPIEIDFMISMIIPEKYVSDVQTRLVLYKRIANAETVEALGDLQTEIIDRFGMMPESTTHLFRSTAIKIKAKVLGIQKIEATSKQGKVIFSSKPVTSAQKLIDFINTHSAQYQFAGSQGFKFKIDAKTPDELLTTVETVVEKLAQLQ